MVRASCPSRANSDDAEQLKTVLLPPGAWGIGRTLDEVRAREALK